MDIILVVLAAGCLVAGLIGSIVPILPACPLGYVGLLLLHASSYADFSSSQLWSWAAVVVLVQVADTMLPIWGAKRFGGSRYGSWGCAIGMLLGLFATPIGLIVGPFFGAVVGELLAGKSGGKAFVAGFGSFVGFIASTLAKLVVSVWFVYLSVAAFF